jgi:hypothetical protein
MTRDYVLVTLTVILINHCQTLAQTVNVLLSTDIVLNCSFGFCLSSKYYEVVTFRCGVHFRHQVKEDIYLVCWTSSARGPN